MASVSMAVLMTFNSIPTKSFALSNNPFEREDSLREKIISSASGKSKKQISINRHVMGDAERYIVVFKENTAFSKIKKALDGYNYRLLADSDERIFLVYIEDEDEFSRKNKEILKSLEKDSIKESFAYYPNDTYAQTYEYGLLGMNEAWQYSLGKKDIIVAIIDSGIYRNHEDFSETNILSGFDYETGQSFVNTDVSGHGTKVAGIIAATGNNGIGCVGIAPKCTLLPIKVTNSEDKIYTSDLIDSLYLAADSGSHVINMSLGNYEKTESEEKAIKYANQKGCILVAAAGNEGNHSEYAGMKCYPASYDGVISVGAVDEAGKSCIFSQHNDAVDISAPGSGLSLLSSEGGYTSDSGTSFSAAYISGIAALSLSILDSGYTMNSDQFDYLISFNSRNGGGVRLGAGIPNAELVLKHANFPLVSGVENGGVYYDNLKIFFNRGTATLDDEEFKSGDLCKHTGEHLLRISEGNKITEISFTTDNLPLTYSLKEGDGYSYISFPFGTATLNGHPYLSDEKITSDGKYTLVLTGLYGNTKTFDFQLSFSTPMIEGVKDGETYDKPIRISVSTGGKIYLDGKEAQNEVTVFEEGKHTLLIRQNGNIKTTINFTLSYNSENNPYKYYTTETSVSKAKSASGFGVIAVWNEINRGIRLYNAENAQLIRYLSVGENISNVYFGTDSLYIAGTNRIFKIKADDIKGNTSLSVVHTFEFPISASDFSENTIYCVESSSVASGTVKKISLDTFETTNICFIRSIPDVISYDKFTNSVAFSKKEDKKIYVSSLDSGSMSMFEPFEEMDGEFIFRNGKISCDGTVFSVEKAKNIFCINDSDTLWFDGITLITDKGTYNTETGEIIGYHGVKFSHVSYSQNLYSAVFDDVSLFISQMLPTAQSNKPLISHGKDFGYTQNLTSSKSIKHTVLNNGKIYASGDENAFYIFNGNTFEFIKQFYLPFVPKGIKSSEKNIYFYSDKTDIIVIYSTETDSIEFLNANHRISDLSAFGKYIALVGDGALYVWDDSGNNIFSEKEEKYISITFSHDGKNLYATHERSFYTGLTAYKVSDFSIEYERVLDYKAEDIFCDSTYLYINTAAYLTRNGGIAAFCSAKIYGKAEDVFVTEKGLVSDQGYISTYNAFGNAFIFKDNKELIVFDEKNISIFKNPYNGSLTTPPMVQNIEDMGNYTQKISVNISKGIGYLNGKRVQNGYVVSDGGEHVLTVILPFGIKYVYRFKINASLLELRIKGGNTAIKVNDTKTFKVDFLPVGSPEEEVVFYCESDIISVTPQGIVTGLKPGEAKLYASTLDGRIYTSINISVLSSMLSFTPSYLGVDRTYGILYGISSGTTVDTLLSFLEPSLRENTKVFHGEQEATGIVKTGMKIVLTSKNAEILDSLTISVIGDCNGDGNVDIGDFVTACRLMNDENADAVFVKSADFSNTGTIDAADTFTYKELILGNEKIVENAGAVTEYFEGNLSFKCIYEKNGTVSVILFAENNMIKGISGKISYDKDCFTFISVEKSGYVSAAEDFDGNVRFLTVFNEEKIKNVTESVPLVKLTFLPVSQDKKTFAAEEILVYTDKTAKVSDLSAQTSEEENKQGLLPSLTPSVGTLIPEFSPENFSYVLRVPQGTDKITFNHGGTEEIMVIMDEKITDGSIIKILHKENEYTLTIIMESFSTHKDGLPLWLTVLISSTAVTVILLLFFGENIKRKFFVEKHSKEPKEDS